MSDGIYGLKFCVFFYIVNFLKNIKNKYRFKLYRCFKFIVLNAIYIIVKFKLKYLKIVLIKGYDVKATLHSLMDSVV